MALRRVRKKSRGGRSAVRIVEEAFHLLRVAPLRWLVWFYAGSTPFAIGALYFTADMARSSRAPQDLTLAALILAMLYLLMCWCQAVFSTGLWDALVPKAVPLLSPWQKFRQVAALLLIQAFAFPAILIALVLTVPLVWVWGFFQNATVLALTHRYPDRPLRDLFVASARHSHAEWGQSHLVAVILGLAGFFGWFNLFGGTLMVGLFSRSLLGIESVFTLNPIASVMNTTFLTSILLLTWLVVSPMAKACYLLRCFYQESHETGADLMSRLGAVRSERAEFGSESPGAEAGDQPKLAGAKRGAALLVMMIALGAAGKSIADESAGGTNEGSVLPQATAIEAFETTLSETMGQKRYQWRLPRRLSEDAVEEERGWFAARLEELAESTREAIRETQEMIRDWMNRSDRNRYSGSGGGDPEAFAQFNTTLSVILVLVTLALAGWVVWLLVRKAKPLQPTDSEATLAAGAIDLESEDLVASDLPEDEWMRLAREQMAKGESRLAVRALFLASLATLGENSFLKIARFKTNRDYRGELTRRARQHPEILAAFARQVSTFERSWYGLHSLGEAGFETFLEDHDSISKKARNASPVGNTGAVSNERRSA